MEKVKLTYPVEVCGVKTDTLTMRRPKVRDELAVANGGGTNAERELKLFANLCEVDPSALEDLDMADYRKLQGVYKAFFD